MNTEPNPNPSSPLAAPDCSAHPLHSMDALERMEMDLEWASLDREMSLQKKLGPQGYDFSRKMFTEAYSLGYRTGRSAPNEKLSHTAPTTT